MLLFHRTLPEPLNNRKIQTVDTNKKTQYLDTKKSPIHIRRKAQRPNIDYHHLRAPFLISNIPRQSEYYRSTESRQKFHGIRGGDTSASTVRGFCRGPRTNDAAALKILGARWNSVSSSPTTVETPVLYGGPVEPRNPRKRNTRIAREAMEKEIPSSSSLPPPFILQIHPKITSCLSVVVRYAIAQRIALNELPYLRIAVHLKSLNSRQEWGSRRGRGGLGVRRREEIHSRGKTTRVDR